MRILPLPSDPRYRIAEDGTVYGVNGKPLKPWITAGRYYTVSIGAGNHRLVHDLVLETFVGSKPDGMVARHGPLGSFVNAITNLCYGTYSDNEYDKIRDGTHQQASKTHCSKGHDYTSENTVLYTRRGYRERVCRACQQEYLRAHKARSKAIKHARGLRKPGPKPRPCCARGHEYSPENTYIRPDDGSRQCKKCRRIYQRGRSQSEY